MAPKLAKLTRPQASKAILRHQLFARFDANAEQPLVWIQGPPGAGKTTLVASYLSHSDRLGVWYQVDQGDNDPASFFYYLGLAVATRRQPMPLLKPEYMADLEGFTRRFFRELYSRLSEGAAIVFDNYQEASASSPLHEILACALNEIPPGVRVCVLSRTEPPPAYARLSANSLILQLGHDDLRLTEEEAALIAGARQVFDAEAIKTLHAQSNGWTAGLILMLERLKRTGAVTTTAPNDTLEAVFDYFAGEIFEQLDASTRDFLMGTCLVPPMTAELANTVTGRHDATSVLAELHRRQLFVDRRAGDPFTYQYHALFTLFLQQQAKKLRSQSEWNALVLASAHALATDQRIEEAIALFVMARAWESAIRLIVTHAQALLRLGRWQTVQQWIESLPEPVRATTPWLRFWLGMCRLHVDPVKAREDLEPAFALFEQRSEGVGQALAAAAINEAHMVEWIDYRRLDPWITVLEKLLVRSDVVLPSLETELAVRAGLFTAIVLRQTYRQDIPQLARRLADMLRHDLDPNYQLLAAQGMFVYGAYSGDFALTDEVVKLTTAAFHDPGASALNRAWYAVRLAHALRYVTGSREQARAWLQTAREIVREHGLRFVEAPIAIFSAWIEEVLGEAADIERELALAQAHANPVSPFAAAYYRAGKAFLLARQHDLRNAIVQMREATSLFERGGFTLGQVASCTALTGMHLESQDFAGVREAWAQVAKLMFQGELRRYAEKLWSAGAALGMNDKEHATRELREAFALGATHGFESVLSERCFHHTTAALCAYALKHGIEPSYAARVVRAQGLAPTSADCEDWPWPVRIHALGGFSLELEDRRVTFSRKAPKKPLELLKVLVVAGRSNIAVDWLEAQLWPEAEGGAAHDTFNVTHSRLRKLLRTDDVLVLGEGKLSLNRAKVWADVWVFERLAEECLEALRRELNRSDIESLGERLLSLYRGELLEGESDAPWHVAARERLRSKFMRSLKALGDYWEASAAWERAQPLYERALEIDSAAEELYQRLMKIHIRGGRRAEALRVYHRCRAMLSSMLAVAPSQETESLFQSIDRTR